jgi:hypothetical protein
MPAAFAEAGSQRVNRSAMPARWYLASRRVTLRYCQTELELS